MNLAKQSAAKTFLIGPILDVSGLPKTDEVVANIKVTKNGTVGSPNGSSTLTHNHAGKYLYAANAADFDTLGEAAFSLNDGNNDMMPLAFQVVSAATYDAIVTNAAGGVDGLAVSGASKKVAATVAAGDAADIPKLKIASTTGNWATVGTWSDGVVPAAGDNIAINNGVTVTVAANLDLGQFGTLELRGSGKLSIGLNISSTTIPCGWVIYQNSGTVTNNYGVVENNSMTITNNKYLGTVVENTGAIANNYGILLRNGGSVERGDVTYNYGTIVINRDNSYVYQNYSVIEYNLGTIDDNRYILSLNHGTATYNTGGIIKNNFGTVTTDMGDTYSWETSVVAAIADAGFNFTGTGALKRVLSSSPPTSGTVGGPNVFTFSMEAVAADPLITDGSATDDSPGVLTDDIWETTTTHTGATTHTQWQVSSSVVSHDPAYTELIGDPSIVLSSSDESVATIDVSGMVQYVADGTCLIIGTSAAIGTSPIQRVEVPIVNSSDGPVPAISYTYVDDPGSVRENATDAIDSRIAVAGKQKAIFSTQDHTTPNYVRNVDCWAADLDLTCCSPWNSYDTNKRAGTLISPRHFICAQHYYIPNGSTIRFVDLSNNVVTRTVVNSVQIGTTDLRVGVLDSDVTGCTFAKVLPDDWITYIPNNGLKIPAIVLDQEEKALVDDVLSIGVSTVQFQVPTNSTRQEFYEEIISGDSGNPSFLIINSELVIMTTWYYGGAGSGNTIHSYKTEIEAAMVTLGGGYSTLTEVDLSGFNTY
jgi:hypothetical protein